jgi:hypothetical protein
MILEDAIAAISNSLQQDKRVQSIFLKGSIGRGERGSFSSIKHHLLEVMIYGLLLSSIMS